VSVGRTFLSAVGRTLLSAESDGRPECLPHGGGPHVGRVVPILLKESVATVDDDRVTSRRAGIRGAPLRGWGFDVARLHVLPRGRPVYESFFGLARRPFAATPDPHCFAETRTARAALDGLERSVRGGGGIALLVAPAGLGKTLLGRRLVATLPEEFPAVFLPSANFATRRALLQSLLYELGQPYARRPEQELRIELTETLRRRGAEGRRTLLFLDEAHLLSKAMLEEARLLTQLQDGPRPLVSVVLAGQLPLEETLAEPGMEALNQRLVHQCYLESLTREESRAYVAHRLAWAGGNPAECLDDAALRFVAEVADGSPRALNQICDHTLLLAFTDDCRPANLATAREAYEDVRQLPLHWNAPLVVDAPAERDAETIEPGEETIAAVEHLDDAGAWAETSALETSSFETSPGEDAVAIEVGAPASDDEHVAPGEREYAVVEVGGDATCDVDDRAAAPHGHWEPGDPRHCLQDAVGIEWSAEPRARPASSGTVDLVAATSFECGWAGESALETPHFDVALVDVHIAHDGYDDEPLATVHEIRGVALDPHPSEPYPSEPYDDGRVGDVLLPSTRLRHGDFVSRDRDSDRTEEPRPMPPFPHQSHVSVTLSPALAGLDTPIAWSEEYVVDHHSVTRDRPVGSAPPTPDVPLPNEARRNLPLLESALAPLVGRLATKRPAVDAAAAEESWHTEVVEPEDEIEDEIERELTDIAADTARAVTRESSTIVEEHRSLFEGERRSIEPQDPESTPTTDWRPHADFRPPAHETYDVIEPEDFGDAAPVLAPRTERPYARLFSEIHRQWGHRQA
jgi:type II secretory pathway predicted ATPase ExeA